MKKILRTLALLHRTVGIRPQHIFLFSFIFINRYFSAFAQPKKIEAVKEPVFLIGHLRSGTTFLHRLLGKADTLSGLTLEPMVFGTGLYGRCIHFLFGKILKRVSLDAVYNPKIHKTGFSLLESDDIAFYFQRFGGLLYWIYFLAWKAFEEKEEIQGSIRSVVCDTVFLERQRALYASVCQPGQRMFSKSFFGIYQVDALRNKYRGARFILLVRNPKEVVASTLSLEIGIQKSLNNFNEQATHLQQRYIQNVYRAIVIYYEQLEFHMQQQNDDMILVHYEDLKNSFSASMDRISRFLDLKHDQGLRNAVEKQIINQPAYASQHKYSLEDYNIGESMIEKDFAAYYQRREEQQFRSGLNEESHP